MCLAGVTWANPPFAVRSARSLVRTAFSEASLAVWAGAREAHTTTKLEQISLHGQDRLGLLIRLIFFLNFITRDDFSGAAQSRGHATVFMIRKLNCTSHSRRRQTTPAQNVFDLQAGIAARKL